MIKHVDYEFRSGKRIIKGLYPELYQEICSIVEAAECGFNKAILESFFIKAGWLQGCRSDFHKSGLAVMIELDNKEKMYSDIISLMYIHQENRIEAGIIISAFETGRTRDTLKLNVSLFDVQNFFYGERATSIVTVPIWYIGI